MKKLFSTTLFTAAALLLVASPALAQNTVTVTATPPATANIDLTVSLTLESAVVLTLAGTAAQNTTLVSTGPGTGSIDMGNVNTACSVDPQTNGFCKRTSDAQGAYFVVGLDATVTVSGGTTYSLGIQSSPPVGINSARYKACAGTCPAYSGDNTWTVLAPVGTGPIPALAGTELANGTASGSGVQHQLAFHVLDAQTPGTLSPVVTYVATTP